VTPEIVFKDATAKLAEYEATGGYTALATARAMTPQEVTDELITAELRGRGGAFFPTGTTSS
jgi:NADH:ubiquinone oxidoreductase subunit F (NADH-binding)